MTDRLYIPDCLFPTDNQFDIPTLLPEPKPDFFSIPFLCFGEQRRSKNMRGTGILHFYTDDYRFSSIYEHPEKILRHNPGAIVEPNYSLFNETPYAFGLQAVYKKRWISRICQQRGIPVFIDLNVAAKFSDLNMLGIPRGYQAYATRAYTGYMFDLQREYEIALNHADGNPIMFLVYGGGKQAEIWCRKHPDARFIFAGNNE